MLNVRIELDGSIPVVRLAGRFDGFGATEFDKSTNQLRAGDCAFWVVDLGAVEYLSSAGIRSLVSAEKALRAVGGRLVLVGMNAMLEEVLDTTGLLEQFLRAADTARGVVAARAALDAGGPWRGVLNGLDFEMTPIAGADAAVVWWGPPDWSPQRKSGARELIQVRLNELGFALGVGGMGTSSMQAAEGLGDFIAAGAMMGVLPSDEHGETDFVLTTRPEETTAYLAFGVSFHGLPTARLRIEKVDGGFTLEQLGIGLTEVLRSQSEGRLPVGGLVLACETQRVVGDVCPFAARCTDGDRVRQQQVEGDRVLLVGLIGDCAQLEGESAAKSLVTCLQAGAGTVQNSTSQIHAHAILVDHLALDVMRDDPLSAVHGIADLDQLRGVLHLAPETEFSSACGWLFVPKTVRSGEESRVSIEWPPDLQVSDEWDSIVRQIYHDASRVVPARLHGGFSATTLQVTAYDAAGRQMLPTVLKLESIEMGRREETACREYVQKYILNNGTVILGTATQGRYMGVRYNFVGITGAESRLTWLREHYMRRPSEELIPIFDRIFTDILKPWYGQPRWDRVRLFDEHTPAADLFPTLLEDAREQFGVLPDEPTFRCPWISRPLPNPYYVLKHVYPERCNETFPWYTGINHGDLNMQNILLDERENIYIIDFSETRVRNIVSDFARLEPIFLFETLRLDTDDDVHRAAEFIEPLIQQGSLSEMPRFTYSGDDPLVAKAYSIICRLRHYANVVTLFETRMTPYWLAMLQWTLPVASYRGISSRRKQVALYTSALLCEQMMK